MQQIPNDSQCHWFRLGLGLHNSPYKMRSRSISAGSTRTPESTGAWVRVYSVARKTHKLHVFLQSQKKLFVRARLPASFCLIGQTAANKKLTNWRRRKNSCRQRNINAEDGSTHEIVAISKLHEFLCETSTCLLSKHHFDPSLETSEPAQPRIYHQNQRPNSRSLRG